MKKAVKANMPLSGIVHVSQSPTRFELQLVCRHPVNMFGRKRVQFQDDEGIWFHGMWCAKLVVEEESTVESTEAFSEIQSDASLSAVAIPLWCILGKEHPHANYCWVTANWWKHRMDDGAHRLPKLDSSLCVPASSTEDVDLGAEPAFPTQAAQVRNPHSEEFGSL